MKKILFSICVIVVVLGVFIYFNVNTLTTNEKVENGQTFCENIIFDLNNGSLTISEDLPNVKQIKNYVDILKSSDEHFINLSSYFHFLETTNENNDVSIPEESNLTEEELKDLYERLNQMKDSFEEEDTIYENNGKCIKVNDLRRLDNNDAIVKYYDGEYVIPSEDIPVTFSYLKENNFFDFKLTNMEMESDNIYSYTFQNTSNLYPSIFIFNIYFKGNTIDNFTLVINGFTPFDN